MASLARSKSAWQRWRSRFPMRARVEKAVHRSLGEPGKGGLNVAAAEEP